MKNGTRKPFDAEVKEEWYTSQDQHSKYLSGSVFDIAGNLKPDEKGEARRIRSKGDKARRAEC